VASSAYAHNIQADPVEGITWNKNLHTPVISRYMVIQMAMVKMAFRNINYNVEFIQKKMIHIY
jgi:hypothetical protein